MHRVFRVVAATDVPAAARLDAARRQQVPSSIQRSPLFTGRELKMAEPARA